MEEYPGISIWDFAYPNGTCRLQQSDKTSSCHITKEIKQRAHRRYRDSAKSLSSIFVSSTDSSEMDDSETQSKSSSKSRSKCKRHRQQQQEPTEKKTYLLSIPRTESLYCAQIKGTISTLLLTPQTRLILLVPQSHIVCQKVFDLQRLPKGDGTTIQILPVPPTITMECATPDEEVSGIERSLELLAVDEIAKKVVTCTKVKRFDGYLSFEDERASWLFLEQVGKSVAQSTAKR